MNGDILLLVEDNADDETLAIRALRKHAIQNEIIVARDGVEALELLHGSTKIRPCVVFLDLKLPKIDGLQVLQKIRAHDETNSLPVVVFTSSDEPGDVSRAYAAGANSYVRKPVEFVEFSQVVGCLGTYWLRTNVDLKWPHR